VEIPLEVRNLGRDAVATYERALPYGERWALMCATQTPPGTKGADRTFMSGRMNQQWLDDMPKKQAKTILAEAKQAGISTAGKVYMGGLADHRRHQDPMAWVDSTGDILKVARARNLTVEGVVNHKGTPMPPQRTVLNERIISEELPKYRKRHPAKKDGELREMIINKQAHPLKRKGK
jgi:hypothetical protein